MKLRPELVISDSVGHADLPEGYNIVISPAVLRNIRKGLPFGRICMKIPKYRENGKNHKNNKRGANLSFPLI
ncbi:hypothetical protein SDC9_165554 [bioreactor metagenome]|uniref:Uncharacterized protein n=1 Tax=bioreactor metagenome TaxID=1076179 RepID=A0A645FWG2_9ZZZZ